jgi:two-component system CheB/CheR fusion protein
MVGEKEEELAIVGTTHELENHIVCIGASAGGMEAIHEIFDNISTDTNFGFIVIQHLSSDHKSLMGELLSKHTSMKVVEASNYKLVRPNTIYVIPNNRNITIKDRTLVLSEKPEGRLPNMAIDIFLQSLAEDVGNKAIAVILSGTGTDGTKGILAVKKAGGLVFVQDPTTAKFDGMPSSAIKSGQIDFILSPESIAEELESQHQVQPLSTIVDSLPVEQEATLLEMFDLLNTKTASNFAFYKRPTVIRRLTKRMALLKQQSLQEYVKTLRANNEEVALLKKEFLIGVTKFFRDPLAFEELSLKVIPEIVKSKENADTIKVWVAACSTGEEAYSIAILLKEHLSRLNIDRDIKIFASDINKESIEYASKGRYPGTIANDVRADLLAKYFVKENNKYRVLPQLRKMIVFAHHDLLKNPPFGKMDLVSCRNMLIYIEAETQLKIMAIFHFSLNVGGYLFLGPSESIGSLKDKVKEVSKKWKIYKNVIAAKSVGLELVSFTDKNNNKQIQVPGSKADFDYSKKTIVENVLNRVAEQCNLAGALVDSDCNILETFGDYRKYLQLPEQKFANNLLKMLPLKASILLGSIFRKTVSTHEKVSLENVELYNTKATVTVRPVATNANSYFVILFQEVRIEVKINNNVGDVIDNNMRNANLASSQHIQEMMGLEVELVETKEFLQKALEQSSDSNEEMQTTNEELLSSNEELQSANEELQSLNEELHTVNAENQLRIKEISELNDDLDNYLSGTDIGQIFLDKHLQIRKFTPAVTSIVNLIASDIGRPFTDISNNLSYRGLMHDIRTVLKTSETINKLIATNTDTLYQMKIQSYLREGKSFDGIMLTFVDVTLLKNAELHVEAVNQELKDLNDDLLRSNRELEQFAYITSHDLQEPLRKIQSFVELVRKDLVGKPTSTRYLEKISQSASRMTLLIKDVLTYSRLSNADVRFAVTDLNEVVQMVMADFELLIAEKDAKIIFTDLPAVKGIGLQFQQLFANLISNSLKFCGKDPIIEITCSKVSPGELPEIPDLKPERSYFKIVFKDNGIGFDQQYATQIFAIFQRLNHRNLYAGSGIGLALCKRIVENHEGFIFAKSSMDCGATFEIYLPE